MLEGSLEELHALVLARHVTRGASPCARFRKREIHSVCVCVCVYPALGSEKEREREGGREGERERERMGGVGAGRKEGGGGGLSNGIDDVAYV
jgi:hypothetical protein